MKNGIMTFRKLIMTTETMNSIDTLTLKALELKRSIYGQTDGRMLDHIIESNPKSRDEAMRNICAFIHKDLFAEVEQVCTNLDLSKREFVEMAIIDLIAKANEIMTRHDVFQGLDNQEEA